MLKQVFDKEQLYKVLSPSDIWKWDLLSFHGDVEAAVDHTVKYWKSKSTTLSLLKTRTVKGKSVFTPDNMEDAFAIKLLDRFIRRIYKVRQSDRNRVIRQLRTLLKDSGDYHVLRLDIKDCYETIKLKTLIDKFEEDLILAPECLQILKGIHTDLRSNHDVHGLPRGLSISPTLAELYLETLDARIAAHPDVIYSSRYVDDIVVITAAAREVRLQADLQGFMNDMGIQLNPNPDKYYSGPSRTAEFDYLGYCVKVESNKGKPNRVKLEISRSKLNKLKSRIALSFCDYRSSRNLTLLKRRLEYLCMLKRVRKGKNGDLLAGLANNYQYVTDGFECLRSVDGFLCQQVSSPRFRIDPLNQKIVKKISMYGNARKRNVGKFSNKQTIQVMQAWKNA